MPYAMCITVHIFNTHICTCDCLACAQRLQADLTLMVCARYLHFVFHIFCFFFSKEAYIVLSVSTDCFCLTTKRIDLLLGNYYGILKVGR